MRPTERTCKRRLRQAVERPETWTSMMERTTRTIGWTMSSMMPVTFRQMRLRVRLREDRLQEAHIHGEEVGAALPPNRRTIRTMTPAPAARATSLGEAGDASNSVLPKA